MRNVQALDTYREDAAGLREFASFTAARRPSWQGRRDGKIKVESYPPSAVFR